MGKPLANNPNVLVAPYTPPTPAELEFTSQFYAGLKARSGATSAGETSLLIGPESGRPALGTVFEPAMGSADVLLTSQLTSPWVGPDSVVFQNEGDDTILKPGDSGDDVKRLQEDLKKAGYDPGKIDGVYGPDTERAVKKLQEDNGLKVDGKAGPDTKAKLEEVLAGEGGGGKDGDDEARPAAPGKIDKVKSLNEMLKDLEGKMTEEQKKQYEKLEKEKIDKLLKELEEELKKWSGDGSRPSENPESIITAADKVPWNNEENVKWLAKVIMSEASIGNSEERTAVGYVVLNRMKRNGENKVEEVVKPNKFAYNQEPTKEIEELARGILKCTVADNSGGATHFYSPQAMPKEGDDTTGYDIGGGLEKVAGVSKKNYRPGWAGEGKYPRVPVGGAVDKRFKFHRQPGSGPVS